MARPEKHIPRRNPRNGKPNGRRWKRLARGARSSTSSQALLRSSPTVSIYVAANLPGPRPHADIEAIVRQKICGHATDEMSDLYSTVPQREIQAAVGTVISLAKYRDLLQDGASWWESGGETPETDNGHPAVTR
jgi:hypothetical protein